MVDIVLIGIGAAGGSRTTDRPELKKSGLDLTLSIGSRINIAGS
jgi:hypothetical protein